MIATEAGTQAPLSGIRVLDLSTFVPGPMATLLLAEAGATVIKVERPGTGDQMRRVPPHLGDVGATFALLNRRKRLVVADLKDETDRRCVLDLVRQADVVVEQFRPGVAARLGLGYEDVRAINPQVVYCSISGYGQQGPRAGRAAHDLNYLAESGLLSLATGSDGTPAMPFTVLADIAGGAYPAVLNILLALRMRDASGEGTHLDIAMAANVGPLAYRYLAKWEAETALRGQAEPPVPNGEHLTGGTARYRLYRTGDDRFVAVAAVEDHFWQRLAELIDLPETYTDDHSAENRADPRRVIDAVARRIAARTAAHWEALFDGEDVCATVVASFAEAVASGTLSVDREHLIRTEDGTELGSLPIPLSAPVRAASSRWAHPPATHISAVTGW